MTFRPDDGDRDKFNNSLHHYKTKKFNRSLHYYPQKIIHPEDTIKKYKYLFSTEGQFTTQTESLSVNYTYIYNKKINTNGYIKQIKLTSSNICTILVKFFTKTSTHFKYIKEYSFNIKKGFNSISCYIPVENNYYMGFYSNTACVNYIHRVASTENIYYKNTNIISNIAIADLFLSNKTPSVKIDIIYKKILKVI